MWEDMTLGAEETPMKHCFPNYLQQWKEQHGGGGGDGGGGKILFKHVGTSLANTCMSVRFHSTLTSEFTSSMFCRLSGA